MSTRIELDVGGVKYTTSLTTLTRFPDSMIGCMFSGRHALQVEEDGYFFIDRDGRHFHHILNFLRSPEGYKVEIVGADERELRRECEYYGIDQLMFPSPVVVPVTQKSLFYYDMRGYSIAGLKVGVQVDGAGMYTLQGSGEPIDFCPHCHRGFTKIKSVPYFVDAFDAQP
ncbi:BTB/POZ protein [Ochromonadaceae sp. CCMP2298]|nr:BTB/POZ protein [Ochromonadaceae sp. CCMP2298]